MKLPGVMSVPCVACDEQLTLCLEESPLRDAASNEIVLMCRYDEKSIAHLRSHIGGSDGGGESVPEVAA